MSEQELEKYILLYRTTVYRLAHSYLKNHEDAEDISQEAFVKLYVCKQSFAADENVKAWLIRVTINLCKNLLKSAWRKKRSELTDEGTASAPECGDIGEFLHRLKPEYAGPLYLYYYEGYSMSEIAHMYRLTESSVRSRLSRARNQLRKMLSEEGAL